MKELGKAAVMTEDILADRKLCVSDPGDRKSACTDPGDAASDRRAERDKRSDGMEDVQSGPACR